MNITQLQETINHNLDKKSSNLSSAEANRTARPMDGTERKREEAQPFQDYIQDDYEITQELESPRLVIRGVLPTTPSTEEPRKVQKTKLDYLKFSCQETLAYVRKFLSFHLGELKFLDQKKGNQGYKRQTQFYLKGELIGWFFWLGNREDYKNNVLVEITGQGCALINDLYCLHSTLKELTEIKLRRLDIALDIFDPLKNWDYAFNQYELGRFKAKNAPHNPKYKIDHEIHPIYRTGRTLYIGDRKHSPKFIRIYEKNLQILSKFRGAFDEEKLDKMFKEKSISHENIDAEDFYNWVRYEVEFKDLDTPLNLDMIIMTDNYFGGVNGFFMELVEVQEIKKIKYLPRDNDFEEELAYQNLSNQWGSFLMTQLQLGKSPIEIMRKILEKSSGKIHQKSLIGKDPSILDYYEKDKYFQPSEWD